MTDLYEIRKDVPMPSEGGRNGLCATIRRMSSGDSIVISAGQHLSVHTSARSVGAKVKTRSNKDGTVTVWRIDSPSDTAAGPGSAAAPNYAAVPALAGFKSSEPGWPKIQKTVGNPALGLPDGYWIQEGPFASMTWCEGKPPVPADSAAEKSIFD